MKAKKDGKINTVIPDSGGIVPGIDSTGMYWSSAFSNCIQ